jgi:hypothetical protein
MRLLTLFLLSLSLSCFGQGFGRSAAFMGAAAVKPVAGGGACNTVHQDSMKIQNSSAYFGYNGYTYSAHGIIVTNTVTVCSIDVVLRIESGSGVPNSYVSFHNNAGDNTPGTLIGSESDPIPSSTLTSSFSTNKVAISATLTAGSYWLVFRASAKSGANYNTISISADNGPCFNNGTVNVMKSDDAITWANDGSPFITNYRLYK